MDNTISACLIVKDEEKVISNCLKSIQHIADEIIVVDTGSSDNTVEIAKQYNAKVIKHYWKDDFSDARNKSLEFATKSWILVLDADERIDYHEALALKEMLEYYNQYVGFIMKLVNIRNEKKDGSASVFRLFKNNSKYRFSGKIHEQIMPSIKRSDNEAKIGSCNISILHSGYDCSIVDLEKKSKRNLKILNSYMEDEKDGYYYYSLGNEYARIKDWKEAIHLYNKALNLAKQDSMSEIYVPYLYINLIKVLFSCEKYMSVIKTTKECENYFEGFKDIYLFSFLSYFKCGYYSKAKKYLNIYFDTNNKSTEYPTINLDHILGTGLETIIKTINENISQARKNLLSVIISGDTSKNNIHKAIVSANEITNEVIVLCSKNDDINIDKLINLGARVIASDSEDNREIFIKGIKHVNNEFILLLKPSEILPSKFYKSLPIFLEQTSENYFNIKIRDTNDNTNSKEFRLYRNSNSLRKIDNFDDYINYIEVETIVECSLYLEKVYEEKSKGLKEYVDNS